MSGKYLLDTNIIIALFADDTTVKENLSKAEETFISSVVVGELCYGARKSARVQENLTRIDEFAASSVVLGCDTDTARRYGEIKNALRIREGKMAVVDLIQKKVELLPEPTQQEILDFVDYLLQKARQEDVLWSKLSLRWVLQGLEDEEWPEYDVQALKER